MQKKARCIYCKREFLPEKNGNSAVAGKKCLELNHIRTKLDPLASVSDSTVVPLDLKNMLKIKAKTFGEVSLQEMRGFHDCLIKRVNLEFSPSMYDLADFHREALGKVWKWAGENRKHQTNIGVEPHQISTRLKQLFDNVNYWIQNDTYSKREIAIRMHHGIVTIHPFVDGNGRTSRLYADLFLLRNNEATLSDAVLRHGEKEKKAYIDALNKATATGSFADLIRILS